MRMRNFVLPLAVVALFQVAGICNPTITFKIVGPGATVTTFSFQVEVEVPAGYTFDPNTDVSLNFGVLPMTGPGPVYTATVNAGEYNLQDTGNILIAKAIRNSDSQQQTRGLNFEYAPPCKARAFEITDGADLLTGGPLVHNSLGDFRIDNCSAIFVVQKGAVRDMYSVGPFGGTIIDAALTSDPTADSFLEFQSLVNVENVFNAQTVTVLNDGQNGLAAEVEACGPDDLISFANPSSQVIDAGLGFPPQYDDTDLPIEGCSRYTLEPGTDTFIRVDTRVENQGVTNLNLVVGDWMNGGGQLEQWTTPAKGVGAGLFDQLDSLSYHGFREGAGIDYQYVPIPLAPPNDFPANYFSVSGVTIISHDMSILNILFGAVPPFTVPAGGHNTYTRYFGVGDGTGSNAIDMENIVRPVVNGDLSGCVTANGVPVEGAKVTVGTLNAGAIDNVVDSFRTRAGVCPNFSGTLAEGSYGAAAALVGYPYENGVGDPNPVVKNITIANGVPESVNFALPQSGRICVDAEDEGGSPITARVTVVGFDPSPEPIIPGTVLLGFSGDDLGLFNDVSDIHPFGVSRAVYTDENGNADFDVEPGSYQLYVSKGTEYSAWSSPIAVAAGACSPITATITRVVDTPGFVSSDFHVHGIRSADSRITDRQRVLQFSGEGIEVPVMTDHHVHTDLNTEIAALSLSGDQQAIIGEEITTFDYGHFNAYPMTIDPSKPSGGSTDWGIVAPAGTAFPSYGNYVLRPSEIDNLAKTGAQSTANTVVQINHIDSHFLPLRIDSSVVPPTAFMNGAQRAARRLPPGADNLFHHFEALELWNGYNRSHANNEFLNDRIGIWFNHLNQGLLTTAIADTDTHKFDNLRTAGARSWTASTTDDPAAVDPQDVGAAVTAGKVVGGQGGYVQTVVTASGGTADLTAGGSTLVTDDDGNVSLSITVQSPIWARWDTIEVYSNSTPNVTGTTSDAAVNVLFDAGTPTVTLSEGDCDPSTTGDGDFDISTVVVDGTVPGGDRYEATVNVPLALGGDAWIVVLAKGTDGVCQPMFPIYPADLNKATNTTLPDLIDGNVGEGGVMMLGVTNALYVDVGGDGWKGPLEP